MTAPALTLASASPRRLSLLRRLGLEPRVLPARVEERRREGEDAEAYVLRVARDKAGAVDAPGWVLAADTAVALGRDVLGKPGGRDEAREMLRRLSGREHRVTTGVCLLRPGGREAAARTVTSRVVFREVPDDELEAYLDTGEWRDKAGSYAIQGIAAMFAAEVHGSVTNVVGLPLSEVVQDLRAAGAVGTLPAAAATAGEAGP